MSEILLKAKESWPALRETIFWLIVCTLIAIAALEGGYIIGHHAADQVGSEIRKLNSWVIDHGGRIESLETMDRRDKTGTGKPPAKKEVGK